MELGSRRLGHRVVGGIPDQQVPEAERLIARERRRSRVDQLFPHETDELRIDLRRSCELQDSTAMEHLTLDRTSLDHCALVGRKLIDSGLEEGLDGRWDAYVAVFVDECDDF